MTFDIAIIRKILQTTQLDVKYSCPMTPRDPGLFCAREPQLRLQREAAALKSNRDVGLFYSDCWLGLREDPEVLTSSFRPNNTLMQTSTQQTNERF